MAAPTKPAAVEVFMCPASTAMVVIATRSMKSGKKAIIPGLY
jgi:hypothetical protein